MKDETSFTAQRNEMVDYQLIRRGIHDPRVLDAMRTVPRHRFVLPEQLPYAYSDGPLPIGYGQTISQPYIVAFMTQLLQIRSNESVLEIGTGSGYQAAILSRLAEKVYTIERHASLAQRAQTILEELGYDNVHIYVGDGTLGLPTYAPYDAIMVTAAAPRVPSSLLEQLTPSGRLVIPIGGRGAQYLDLWTRTDEGFDSTRVLQVAFVPLIGEDGWQE